MSWSAGAWTVLGIFRHGLLQRIRRGRRGDLSDIDPRHGTRRHLQQRAPAERDRAVPRRDDGAIARLWRGVHDDVDLLHHRRSAVAGNSGDAGKIDLGSRIEWISDLVLVPFIEDASQSFVPGREFVV